VGADGANKKRQLERFFVLNRRAEGAGQRREEIGSAAQKRAAGRRR
jgi:hypothetical protein